RHRRRHRGRRRPGPLAPGRVGPGIAGGKMSSQPVAVRAVAVSLVALGFVAVAAAAPVRVDTNVNAKMRDGVELTADVYRPEAEGRFPTLLERTPYDRKGATPDAMILAAAGYAVVIQDARGRFGSEGEFYPFRHEAQDGYDTIEWAAAQPWSNGRVGMFGGSYV